MREMMWLFELFLTPLSFSFINPRFSIKKLYLCKRKGQQNPQRRKAQYNLIEKHLLLFRVKPKCVGNNLE